MTARSHRLLASALLGLLLLAGSVVGTAAHAHSDAESAAADATLGLDEQLGAKLPLDLSFRDEQGQSVRLADLIDGPTLILPVYYSCSNVCNFLQGGLARTLPQLKLAPGTQYRVLSISFDETEGFALAARYRRTYYQAIGAPFPPEGWRFLTGDAENIRRFTTAIGFHFRREGHDFVHPVVSCVVSRDGTIVRYLYGTSFLPKDLGLALVEAGAGRVSPTIRKVVEFCFSYDSQQKTYVFNLLRVAASVVLLSAASLLAILLLSGRKPRPKKELP